MHIQFTVEISYDPRKNERNILERGLSFERAADFEFETAEYRVEYRNSELRYVALGYLDCRLHFLCYIQTAKRGPRDQL